MSCRSNRTLLPELLNAEVDATVFVPKPASEQDIDLSLAAFARQIDTVDAITTPTQGDARDVLQEDHIRLLSLRLADYLLAMKRFAAAAERVVGVVKTTPPSEERLRPGIVGQGFETIVKLADMLIAE